MVHLFHMLLPPRILTNKLKKLFVKRPIQLTQILQYSPVNLRMFPALLIIKTLHIIAAEWLINTRKSLLLIEKEMLLFNHVLQVEKSFQPFQFNTWRFNKPIAIDKHELFQWKELQPVFQVIGVDAVPEHRLVQHELSLLVINQLSEYGGVVEVPQTACQASVGQLTLLHSVLFALDIFTDRSLHRIAENDYELDVGVHAFDAARHIFVHEIFWRFLNRYLVVI